ncbi:unnamed protein product [Fraxinus pennsylvanica]|uniref:Uncharacterized protein n=1 Tax=Fraxinus pennsylvanica TaxID=56036 RepID=A0AAD2A7T8_9LAMI|nr:unnamed protein product [Fraxinus pennsylvanica]
MLALGVTEKDTSKHENLKFKNSIMLKLDSQLGGFLLEASSEEDFTGMIGQSIVLRLRGLGSKRIGLIRLGSTTSAIASYRNLGETLGGSAKTTRSNKIAIILSSFDWLSEESKLATTIAIATGTIFFVSFLLFDRRVKNMRIASEYSDVFTATILDVEQCKQLKMGSYLDVAAASANPPHFIHFYYKPPGGAVGTKPALVGNGLTFDRFISLLQLVRIYDKWNMYEAWRYCHGIKWQEN